MTSISLAAFAIVNLSALAGGLFFISRALRRTWRFARLAQRSSFTAAMRRGRLVAHRQAYRCAVDAPYYLSRIALMFCVNLVALTGVLFASIGLASRPETGAPISLQSWQLFATCSVLIFVIFMAWGLVRTVRLARRVLQIRRNLRTIAARKQRTTPRTAIIT